MKKLLLFLLLFAHSYLFSQTTIFTETMGTVAATTLLANHESANGFDNDGYTMTNGGATNPTDIRATSASTGYTGASAGANVWFTSTSGQYGFAIEGIDASGYNTLTLQFGYRKEVSTSLPTIALDYWDGSAWVNVPFTFTQAANASVAWYLSPVISLPAGAQINGLKLRWLKSGTVAMRMDDVVLKGVAAASAPGAPVANAASNLLDTGFTANWAAAASATQYFLDVSTANDFSSFVTGYNNKDVANVTTFNVTGLTANTQYHYRVRASNAIGTSGNSNTISVTTNPPAPPAPTANAATAVVTDAFTANWSTVAGATIYYLDVSTVNDFSTYLTGYQDKNVGNVLTFNLSGLTAGTNYYYRVRCTDGIGTSISSNVINVITVPAAPIIKAATNISQTSFTAGWNSVTGADKYYLDISKVSDFSTYVTGYQNLDVGTAVSQNVTGVSGNTQYFYRVRANNSSGTSINSDVTTLTTNVIESPTLEAGDIAIIGFNGDDPDQFSFVPLVDLPAGTIIHFTDSGIISGKAFRANEGVIKYTAPAGGANAGVIITYTSPASGDFADEKDLSVGTSGFSLSSSGDQIIAYQGSGSNPTFLYAVHTYRNSWGSGSTTTSESALPVGLVEGVSAIAVGSNTSDYDNAVYNMSTIVGTRDELLTAIGNVSNWTQNNNRIASMPVTNFLIAGSSFQAPVANAATVITTTSFMANWEVFDKAQGFYLDVATDEKFLSKVKGYDNLFVDYRNFYLVSGLESNKTYYYRLRATDNYRISSSSNVIVVTTLKAPTSVQFGTTTGAVTELTGTYNLPISILNPSTTNATQLKVVFISSSSTAGLADLNNYSTQTITFPAGSSVAQNVSLSIVDDGITENSETAVFQIQGVSGGDSVIVGTNSIFTLTITDGTNDYYSSVPTGATGTALRTAIHSLIKNQVKIPYTSTATDVWKALKQADEDPSNSANVKLIYSRLSYGKDNTGGSPGQWNREHVWAQSRGGFNTSTGVGTDIHNLRPEDVAVNSTRSNKDFDNGGTSYKGLPDIKYTTNTWEPPNETKGDVARILLYMDVRYEGESGEPDLVVVDQINGATGTIGKLSTLLQWHQQDPPDANEIVRNNIAYSIQHNKNPFVDHPEWVSSIWGASASLPSAPVATSATNVTKTSLTINWNAVSGATKYLVDVATDISFTNLLAGFDNKDAGTATSLDVIGLTLGTTYYYRVRSFNANGTSQNSNVITATTLSNQATAPSAPVATSASLVTSNGFNANWNQSTGAEKYFIDVSTSNSFTTFVSGYENKDVGTVNSLSVSGLLSSSQYYYRVRAFNSVGTSTSSNVISVTTAASSSQTLSAGDIAIIGINEDDPDQFTFVPLVDLPSGTVIHFTDSGILSGSTFRANEGGIKYTTPVGGITAGTILTFTSPASGDFSSESNESIGNTGFTLSSSGDQIIAYYGDASNPTFLYAIHTLRNAWGSGATNSNESALPAGLTNGLTAIAVGTASADVDNAAYNMSLTTGTKSEMLTAIGNIANWTTSNDRIESLPSGTIKINSQSQEPKPNPPSTPVATTATKVSTTSFTANWGSATGAVNYFLDVATDINFNSLVEGYQNIDAGNFTSYIVLGLQAGTTYYYRVRAANTGGTSQSSNVISVATNAIIATKYSILLSEAHPLKGQTINVIAQLIDSKGQSVPLADRIVTWTSTNSGTFSEATTKTDESGRANVRFTVSSNSGVKHVVTATDNNSITGSSSEIVVETLSVPIQLSPANALLNNPREVKLIWSKQWIAEKYQLQISKDAEFKNLVIDETLVDTTKEILGSFKTVYYWRVKSIKGNYQSDWSDVWHFTTTVPDLPTKPQLSMPLNEAKNLNKNLNLQWQPSKGAESYSLQLSEDPSFSKLVEDKTGLTELTFNLINMKHSQNYFWRVKAYNITGESDYSDVWNFSIIDTIYAPTELTAVADTTFTINLQWKDNSNNESGFALERLDEGNVDYYQFDRVEANVTSYTNKYLEQGKSYTYRIKAINDFTKSPFSNLLTVVVPRASIKAPTNLVTTVTSSGHVVLSWNDNSADEIGFIIYRAEEANNLSGKFTFASVNVGLIPIDTIPANSTKFVDNTTNIGKTYRYQIVTLTKQGVSVPTEAPAPIKPMVSPTGIKASLDGSNAKLTWIDNSSDEAGFIVLRANKPQMQFKAIDTTNANINTFTDNSTFDGRKFYYKVYAYNKSNGVSGETNTDSVYVSMKTPTNLKVVQQVNQNKINLTWVDNSVSESGYIIERKESGQSSFSEITTVLTNIVAFTDVTVTNKKTYSYRIKGYNEDGYSTYSPESSLLVGVEKEAEKPVEFTLKQNYPNPFNPSTTITYSIPERAFVKLRVFDLLGKEIAELINQEQESGTYKYMYNASALSSGTYFYVLEAGNFREVRKLILVK